MREHPRLIFGLFCGCILSIVLMAAVGGCMSTADPLDPAKKISPAALAIETTDQQKKFDDQATALTTQRQTILDDYSAQAEALKAHFQQSATKLTSDTTMYNTSVASFNAKLTAAAADLKAQADRNQKLVELGGNVLQAAGTGTFGPMGMLGTTLLTGALGGLVGVWRDSANKTATLQVKNQTIADLKAVPAPGATPTPAASAATAPDASVGVGVLVQTLPPPALKAA